MANYRDLVNDTLDYAADLRDQEIELSGMWVLALIPNVEENTDQYGDILPNKVTRVEIPVIPLYDGYRQLLNITGLDEDSAITLQIRIRTHDYIPANTILFLDSKGADGYIKGHRWRVLSTQVSAVESFYSRTASLIPDRESHNP